METLYIYGEKRVKFKTMGEAERNYTERRRKGIEGGRARLEGRRDGARSRR
jgi:hypothetical protein